MEISKRNKSSAVFYNQFNDINRHLRDTYAHNTHTHIEGFNSLVKYLVTLRRDNTIDDDVFGELVKRAASMFVEAEVTERVDNILDRKVSTNYLWSLLK